MPVSGQEIMARMFLKGAHFMGGNWVPRILEIGLFAGLILHIVQGYMLTVQNQSKRSVGYAVDMATGEVNGIAEVWACWVRSYYCS
jgi:hypothetical protein